MKHIPILLVLTLTLAASGCAQFSRAPASAIPNTSNATGPEDPEQLSAFFYDGNAFAGDIAGPSMKECTLAAQKTIDAEGRETLIFEISGRSLVDTFARKYPEHTVLSEDGKALVFVGSGKFQMEHPGRDHLFRVYTEKLSDGDALVSLTLKFEPLARGGYRFREFYVSAGRSGPVVGCGDLALVR